MGRRTVWGHEVPWPALLEGSSLYFGLLRQTYCKFGRMPDKGLWVSPFLPAAVCGQRTRSVLCEATSPEVSFLSHLRPMCPCLASPPPLPLCFIFSLSLSLSLKTRVQRINIPWLVSGMLSPASGHWSPLPSSQEPLPWSSASGNCQSSRDIFESVCERSEWCRPGSCLLGPFGFPVCQGMGGWGGGGGFYVPFLCRLTVCATLEQKN